ncbi:MAG: alpha/beta hydrolase [Bacilli bacterium]|nr:alpha/beta hydrolase [Bacilli bacterium]MDD3388931.1 alpha/beta hydrolase [Bacilli bacterium]MDD4344615.1 alpha/beta hydrolase [Bacilli bacterium]MDD4520611.1 alpha/beta hydrolase [Bacilli bacterium]MDY0399303.1 alpha/beta hydrolase [Bacilli bacterium]
MQITKTAVLSPYLLPVYRKKIMHPAFLILPGGGYVYTSLREGAPVASQLNALGYQAFVLDYSCYERDNHFSLQTLLEEVKKSLEYIIENANMLRVNPDEIYVMGFSAGGHLAAIAGSLFYRYIKRVVLAYPALTHKYSAPDVLERFQQENPNLDLTSIKAIWQTDAVDYVSKFTPPTFVWGTADDTNVNPQGAFDYIRRLHQTKIPVEFHLYGHGVHGLSLATAATAEDGQQINPHVASWISLLESWLQGERQSDQ